MSSARGEGPAAPERRSVAERIRRALSGRPNTDPEPERHGSRRRRTAPPVVIRAIESKHTMEPVGLATVAEFLRFWPTSVADPDRVRWELSGMFTGPCGGIGLDIAGLSATGHWEKRDWPTQQWFKEIGVDPFDEGELYVVSQDYEYSFVPVRIFSRREWEGLVHWGIHQSVQGDPDLAERIRAVEAEFYDLDGLLAFTEDRIAGREPWVHDYPLDNPTMMAAMRAAHPQVDYDNLDMQASAETQRHVLRGQTAGPSTGHLIMGAFSAMGAEPRPTDDSDRGAGAETPPSRPG